MMIDPMNEVNLNDISEKNSHSFQTVPTNLFPLNEKDVNRNWAEKTYNKSYLFSDSITSTVWHTEGDLLQWINIAKLLIKDIKWNGVKAGRDRILQLAVHKYNLTLPQNNKNMSCETLRPVNINDVVEIVSNPIWYNDKKKEKQGIIHELVYGITRKIHNFWLIEAEKNWMQQYNIKYKTPNCQRITETRGFVYKLMNSIFSNTTIKMFKRAMISRLGEFISVRDNAKLLNKNNNDINNDYSIVSHEFPTGKGYVVKKLDFISKDENTFNTANQINMQAWIKNCVQRGVSMEDVIDCIRKLYIDECTKELNAEDKCTSLRNIALQNLATSFTNDNFGTSNTLNNMG